jgi:hypothetical protein
MMEQMRRHEREPVSHRSTHASEPAGFGEETSFVVKLLRRAVTEWLDGAEYQSNVRMFRELRDDSRVVSFGSKVVIVEKMDQGCVSIGDGDVPHPAGKASRWARVVQVLNSLIFKVIDDLACGGFRRVVNDNDLNSNSRLIEDAKQRLSELLLAAKRRYDRGYLGCVHVNHPRPVAPIVDRKYSFADNQILSLAGCDDKRD